MIIACSTAALKTNSKTKTDMEDQRRVIHRLSADNARLIRQVSYDVIPITSFYLPFPR